MGQMGKMSAADDDLSGNRRTALMTSTIVSSMGDMDAPESGSHVVDLIGEESTERFNVEEKLSSSRRRSSTSSAPTDLKVHGLLTNSSVVNFSN